VFKNVIFHALNYTGILQSRRRS